MSTPPIDPIAFFQQQFGLTLKRSHGDEYYGKCPWCGGKDRFRVWKDKSNYWCRPGPGHCGKSGFVDELAGVKLSKEERDRLALESRVAALERKQRETERRLSALERMARCTDHLVYHRNLAEKDPDNVALEYWLSEGITPDSIAKYKLGVCFSCPTDKERRPSYTIPVFDRSGTTLINIRHRLMNAPNGNKYRPHVAGLGAQLFHADFTNGHNPDRSKILIVEGEKKSIVTAQEGFANVGIMGKRSFKTEWLSWLEPFQAVYVALDPDAHESAKRLAALFNGRGRVVNLPVKADDFFVKYKGSQDDFSWFIQTAQPIPKSLCH